VTVSPVQTAIRTRRIGIDALAVVAVILLGCLAVWAWTRGSYFFADDWFNFDIARDAGMSSGYLRTGYFGHFAPGHRVLDWILAWKLPANWSAAQAIMLGLYVVSATALYGVMRQAGCGRVAPVGAVAVFCASVVWVRVVQWWASAGHILPATAGTLVAMWASMRYFRTHAARWIVLATASLLAGLAFYEKPALLIGYVILLRYLVGVPGEEAGVPLRERIRRDAPLLVALAAATAVYAVWVLTQGYSQGGARVPLGTYAKYFVENWVHGVAPLVIGQGSPEYAPPVPLFFLIAAEVIVAALLVVSLRRDRRAWRAWAFLAIVWVTNVGLVAWGRIATFGVGIGHDPRYNAELAFLLPLAIALAFRPLRAGTIPPASAAHASGGGVRSRLVSRPWPAVAVAAAGLFLILSATDAHRRVSDHWQGKAAHAWMQAFRTSVDAVRARGEAPVVLDAPLSFDLVGPTGPPSNLASAVVPLIDAGVQVRDDTSATFLIEPDGRLRRPRRSVLWDRRGSAIVAPGPANVVGGAPRVDGGAVCAGDAKALLQVAGDGSDPGPMQFAQIDGTGAAGTAFAVFVDRGNGYGADPAAVIPVGSAPGAGRRIGDGQIKQVLVEIPAGACARRIALFRLA
jgi:hypothetical protein